MPSAHRAIFRDSDAAKITNFASSAAIWAKFVAAGFNYLSDGVCHRILFSGSIVLTHSSLIVKVKLEPIWLVALPLVEMNLVNFVIKTIFFNRRH